MKETTTLPEFPSIDKRPWYRRLSLEHKIALWIGVPTLALTVLAIFVSIFLPELRIELGLDPQPKPDPNDQHSGAAPAE